MYNDAQNKDRNQFRNCACTLHWVGPSSHARDGNKHCSLNSKLMIIKFRATFSPATVGLILLTACLVGTLTNFPKTDEPGRPSTLATSRRGPGAFGALSRHGSAGVGEGHRADGLLSHRRGGARRLREGELPAGYAQVLDLPPAKLGARDPANKCHCEDARAAPLDTALDRGLLRALGVRMNHLDGRNDKTRAGKQPMEHNDQCMYCPVSHGTASELKQIST